MEKFLLDLAYLDITTLPDLKNMSNIDTFGGNLYFCIFVG